MHNALASYRGTTEVGGFNVLVCRSEPCVVVVVSVLWTVREGALAHPAPLSCGLLGYLTLVSDSTCYRLGAPQSPRQV